MEDRAVTPVFGVLHCSEPGIAEGAALARLEGTPQAVLVADQETDLGSRLAGAGVDWWLVLEPDVRLEPQFMRVAARTLLAQDRSPDTCALYSDFMELDAVGHPSRRVAVGGWSKERARWQDYAGGAALIRSDVLIECARAAPGDLLRHLALVAADGSGQVRYVSKALYTRAVDRIPDVPGDVRERLLRESGTRYCLTGGTTPRVMSTWPTVSVVIPTRGSSATLHGVRQRMLDVTLDSVLSQTRGPVPQIVLVVDDDVALDFVDDWRARLGERLAVVATSPPFNFSNKVNLGVGAARGDVVVVLNDDIAVITPDWLANMVALATEPDVGAVGALLQYEDGSIQHAGQVFGAGGVHLLDQGEPFTTGPRRRNDVDRDVTGVTAACLVQRRAIWTEVGGLDPLLPVSFNDVDYCVRIRNAGYRIVQCNSARLHHYESKTRRAGAEPWEVRFLVERLGARLLAQDDPLTAPPEPVEPRAPFMARTRYRIGKARLVLREGGPKALAQELRERGRE